MITSIYSFSHVHGAELMLIFWLVCAAAYCGGSLFIKANRNHIKTILLGLLTAEILIDLAWALIYYDKGSYVNYGIGAAYGLLLWPCLLMMTALVVTQINISKNMKKAS